MRLTRPGLPPRPREIGSLSEDAMYFHMQLYYVGEKRIHSFFADLDVSNNRISTLPSELAACTVLETINIASNSCIQLPPVLAEIPSLRRVNASKNFIADVEVEALDHLPMLEHLDLEGNPLKKDVHDQLSRVTSVRVILSPREQEEWEDLSI